jgi:hypothetical protein
MSEPEKPPESEEPEGSSSAQESPDSEDQPTFDELPPPGFNKAVAEEQKKLSEATGISVKDIQKYERMSEEESQD